MLFGFVITPVALVSGGLFVLAVMLLQILVGMRKIRFKGRTHQKVHKWGAWALLGLTVIHGVMGFMYAFPAVWR